MSARVPSGGARVALLALAIVLATALVPAASHAAAKPKQRATAAKSATRTAKPAAAVLAPPRDHWREARALADRGEPDSALALLRPVIARDPNAFALRWLEAGLTGEAGRPAEAVQLYERLSSDFPDRAGDLRCDLGKERLRAGDAASAARDLRECVATHPEDRGARRRLATALARADSLLPALAEYDALVTEEPQDVELALDRARVLGWMGRHAQAIDAYGAALRIEPGLTAAELGRAKNENWLGRHRAATRRLDAIVARGDADAETWKTLAYARYWDDDPKGALEALAAHHALEPDDREAQELRSRIAKDRSPSFVLGHGRSHDSDELVVASPSLELSWPLATNTTLTAGWRQDFAKDTGGKNDAMQLSAGLRQRWNRALTMYARGTSLTWKDGPGERRGGEAGLILRPADHLRVEVVTVREPVLTRVALDQGISLLSWVAALDLEPWPRVAWHVDGRVGSYSDGNRSERSSASVRWHAVDRRRWDVNATLGVEQLNAHQDLDHGYYDPDFHREWGPGLEIEWRPVRQWSLRGTGRTGWQRGKNEPAEPFYSSSARARWQPSEGWSVALEGGSGDSNLQSAAGYRRSWMRFSLARGF